MSQERIFLETEADRWFQRNPGGIVAAEPGDPVLVALATFDLPQRGALLDVGGAAGRIAAGFLRDRPGWSARVIEPSARAIAAGRSAFPNIEFDRGSISQPLLIRPEDPPYEVVVISSVLHWVDRAFLSRAIANTDAALADGGYMVILDFDAPLPRVNPYAHHPGVYTYKQDYAACYQGLGIYHLEYRRSWTLGSAVDRDDPYDRRWVAAVLRKDLKRRYATSAQ